MGYVVLRIPMGRHGRVCTDLYAVRRTCGGGHELVASSSDRVSWECYCRRAYDAHWAYGDEIRRAFPGFAALSLWH